MTKTISGLLRTLSLIGLALLFRERPARQYLGDPGDTGGNSRGYALTVDEAGRTVTQLLIQDLGYNSAGPGTPK